MMRCWSVILTSAARAPRRNVVCWSPLIGPIVAVSVGGIDRRPVDPVEHAASVTTTAATSGASQRLMVGTLGRHTERLPGRTTHAVIRPDRRAWLGRSTYVDRHDPQALTSF